MLKIGNQDHKTIVDAADEFGVSAKTVGEWIDKKVLPEPPQVVFGLRSIRTFPASYMETALKRLEEYRKNQHKSVRKRERTR